MKTKAGHLSIARSTSNFEIVHNDGNPDIDKLTPRYFEEGAVGGTFVIKGINFSSTPAENIVKIDEKKATVTKASPRSLEVQLPDGLQDRNFDVTVTVNNRKCEIPSGITILNKHDVGQLRAFFNTRNGEGPTNGELLETKIGTPFKATDLNTWEPSGVAWFTSHGKKKLEKFGLPKTKSAISGRLELKECQELIAVNVNNHDLTSIDLTGASTKLRLHCKGNQFTTIELSHPLKIVHNEYEHPENEINPQQGGKTANVVLP